MLTVALFVFSLSFIKADLNYPKCVLANPNITILNTLNGPVQGECYKLNLFYPNNITRENNKVLTWLSIPYAKPPIRELRYIGPQPVENWENPINGTDFPNDCVQATGDGSEDCLYLNIFAPYSAYEESVILKDSSALLPVFVWIYGGGFYFGSTSYYNGGILSTVGNVIVVTINYRVAGFGFMYINGTDAKGNQALLDQNLALKWIHNNAARFGGDKQRITIAGQSAGSWSVGYHLLFKESWPYFNNAILESGNPTRIDIDTLLMTKNQANSIAQRIGASSFCFDTSNNLLKCLQSVNYTMLNQQSLGYQTFPAFVLDSIVFNNKTPMELIRSGQFKKCSILTGSNNFEELSLTTGEIDSYIGDLQRGYLHALMDALKHRLDIDDYIANKIIKLYVPEDQITDNNVDYFTYFIRMITDYQYRCPSYNLAEYYSKSGQNAFVYSYSFRRPENYYNYPTFDGAAHSGKVFLVIILNTQK